ncbi:hypothetical protein A7Q09_06865 [Methylacidiphilum sp. Yel]|uniref:hypothetical protein n=1 Tax=Methylacidiphilum sp. Yel TaxID=1847730 RepID=UPI00106C93C6|nr:hypothetical protein [Methylacidiphilum sp. Yel]TFE68365.1 hypothetical protein A7Q09_06865 [Methylacidiphilum sp. Yel]
MFESFKNNPELVEWFYCFYNWQGSGMNRIYALDNCRFPPDVSFAFELEKKSKNCEDLLTY